MSIACKVRPIGGEALLPDGYRRCEYLESTGTQWIDTGFTPKMGDEFNLDFSIDNSLIRSYPLISAGNGENQIIFLALREPTHPETKSNLYFRYFCDIAKPVNIKLFQKNKFSIYKDGKGFINGTYCGQSLPLGEVNTSLLLYKRVASPLICQGRVYSFSISHNNQLQLNFIPCLDDKGKPCMFDTVSRTSYYNEGTGDFLYKLKTSITRKLPRGYYPLDYLEGSGTQWIDTGIVVTNDLEIRGVFQRTQTEYTRSSFIFGAKKADSYFSGLFLSHPLNDLLHYGLVWGSTQIAGHLSDDHISKISFNAQKDKLQFDSNVSMIDRETSLDYPMYLFAVNNSGNAAGKAFTRIYSFDIQRNGVPQIDFQSCLDPNGKPCMWDYVTRRPFYNQAETDQFIAGMTLEQVRDLHLPTNGGQLTLNLPYEASIDKRAQTALEQARENGWELTLQYAESDVPAGYRKLDFLESTGTQWIDTGVNLSSESVIEGSAALANDSIASIAVWGSYSAADKYSLFWHLAKQEGVDTPIGQFHGVTWFGSATTAEVSKKYQFKQTRGELWIDGELAKARDIEDFSLDFSAALFCSKQPGEDFYYRSASRIYSFTISSANEMQVDYVPCISPEGKLGMYNRINGTLQENAGTGSFIAGLATVDDVLNLWLPETVGELTISVPAATTDSAVEQLRTNNPTWQIAIQYRTDNEN